MSEFSKRNGLKWSLDITPSEYFDGLYSVLSVTDIASPDLNHADNSAEDRSLQERTRGQTNCDHSTTRTDVRGGLLEGTLRDGQQDDSVRSKTIRGRSLDVLDDILGLGEVNEGLIRVLVDEFSSPHMERKSKSGNHLRKRQAC